MRKRPDWDEYFLNIAKAVSRRGTCLRRRFGAVIVRDNVHISDGYVGSPRGTPNCIDIGYCLREQLQIPSGFLYEICRSVHAEENSIINAARNGVSVVGAKLYLYGEDIQSGKIYPVPPCWRCKKAIINAGIDEVIAKEEKGFKTYRVSNWMEDLNRDPDFYLKDQYEGIKRKFS
ncbi:MAG TPA: hypothetical protein EYP78_04160 [Candidatus Omnitrophica bacterium]|nr:hypothetical protein [Candidatus Omnitrophota bacterium]